MPKGWHIKSNKLVFQNLGEEKKDNRKLYDLNNKKIKSQQLGKEYQGKKKETN